MDLEYPHRKGVYCNWDGWLYNSIEHYRDKHRDEHYHRWFDAANGPLGKELFTFINVYCNSDNTVRYFAKAVGGNNNGIPGELHYPFQNRGDYQIDRRAGSEYPYIRCNWTGWLFWDMTNKKWTDSSGDEDRERFSYERHYAIDNHDISHEDKGWVNGRVMNPFCSYDKERGQGIVTTLRVYCFYSKHNRCSDLKPKG